MFHIFHTKTLDLQKKLLFMPFQRVNTAELLAFQWNSHVNHMLLRTPKVPSKTYNQMILPRNYLGGFEYDTTAVDSPVAMSKIEKQWAKQKRSTKTPGNKDSSLTKVFVDDAGNSERLHYKINLF